MWFTVFISIFAVIAHAFPPAEVDQASKSLIVRQTSSSTELEDGVCRAVTFIFARGTAEGGNMGTVVGPNTCVALKQRFGSADVACQGVGGPYWAILGDNLQPRGTSTAGIEEGSRLFTLASTKCPSTIVITGGYSQGAALIAASLSDLSQNASAVANKVASAVLFGYTKNKQNDGQIPNFPKEKTKIFCASEDLVCQGTLLVTAAHLIYGENATAAADFLAQRVAIARG